MQFESLRGYVNVIWGTMSGNPKPVEIGVSHSARDVETLLVLKEVEALKGELDEVKSLPPASESCKRFIEYSLHTPDPLVHIDDNLYKKWQLKPEVETEVTKCMWC